MRSQQRPQQQSDAKLSCGRQCRDIVKQLVHQFKSSSSNPSSIKQPQEIVTEVRNHFKNNYREHRKSGRVRKSSYLSTAQNSLSAIKRELKKFGFPDSYTEHLHLSVEDMTKLNAQKANKLHTAGQNLVAVAGDDMVLDCRDVLTNPKATRALKLVALACLTGRRTVELLYSARFDPPKQKHSTHEQFWSHVSGLAKQRGEEMTVEIPLLEQRSEILKSLQEVRNLFPRPPEDLPEDERRKWVNTQYAKEISRTMRKHCPIIAKVHNFRKFYAAMCVRYFAENDASDIRMASDYLGHRKLSGTVLTYMNFRVTDTGSLNFVHV